MALETSRRTQLAQVSVKDVADKIKSKADLYEAALRNGFFLPKFKSSVVTEDYIYGVLTGTVLCPKYKDIKLLPCPKPPDKETLISYAQDATADQSKSLGIDGMHTPDKSWLLAIISTYDPSCEIFRKSYVPAPRVEKMENKAKIALPADFLEGLPASRRKTKAKRLGIFR